MKALVVDDNKYVVESLKKRLNWEAFGIHEIFGCYDVESAREILLKSEIDFVITDIEMPGENGFDLLEWIKKQEMNPETVLLTSYADFAYARKAVTYQCFDYLLKPLETDALENVVSRMVSKRIQYRKSQKLEKYGNNWLSHQNLIREMFWRNIIEEDAVIDRRYLERRIQKEGLPYRLSDGFVTVLICLEEEKAGFSRDLLCFSCENVLREVAGDVHKTLEFLGYNGYAQFAAVFCADTEEEYEKIRGILTNFIRVFFSFYHTKITAYISNISSLTDTNVRLRKLEEYYLDDLLRESGVFLERDFRQSVRNTYQAPEIDQWKDMILKGNLEELEQSVHGYFEKMRAIQKINDSFLKAVLTEWNILTVNILKDCNITAYQIVTRFRNQEQAEMAERSVSCMEKLIVSEAAQIAEQIHYVEKKDAVINNIKSYIAMHLDSVTRSQIANTFYLSPNYLSKLFHRQTGLSLSDYIQKQRMDHAKSLLKQTDMSISQIAAEVGYPSFAHFSKQFKKLNDMTPNEYRRRLEQKKSILQSRGEESQS